MQQSITPLDHPNDNRILHQSLNLAEGFGVDHGQNVDNIARFEATLSGLERGSAFGTSPSPPSNQSATDRAYLPVFARFVDAKFKAGGGPSSISGLGTRNLILKGTKENRYGQLNDSFLSVSSFPSQLVYNETVTKIGKIEYQNGEGFHDVTSVKLEIKFGLNAEPNFMWINLQQANPSLIDYLFLPTSWTTVDLPSGKAKAYSYGFVLPGDPTPPSSAAAKSLLVHEGGFSQTEIRMTFFGIDHDDEFREATNLGFIHGEVMRTNWISHLHDTDMYRFSVASGQRVAFDINTPGLGLGNDKFRARLTLFDSTGRRLNHATYGNRPMMKAPDETEWGWDPYFEHTFAEAGEYYVAVNNNYNGSPMFMTSENLKGTDNISKLVSFDYNSSQALGWYRLTLSDPDDQLVEAVDFGEIQIGTKTRNGQLFSGKDVDMYSFSVVSPGQVLAFDLDYLSGFLGKGRITLFGPLGKSLFFTELFNGWTSRASSGLLNRAPNESQFEPYFEYRFNQTGKYHIAVSAFNNFAFNSINGRNDVNGGGTGRYSLSITNVASTYVANPNRWSGSVSIPNKASGRYTIVPTLETIGPNRHIQADKETWIVVHGRADNSHRFLPLAKNLQSYFDLNSSVDRQVLLLDWRAGAADNLSAIGLQGSEWIPYVAKWVESILETQLRVFGHDLSLIGHSWGSYLSYEIAHRVAGEQRAIVALDPAQANHAAKLLGLDRQHYWSNINFSQVSQMSWAYYGGGGLFGDANLARTAHEKFYLAWQNASDGTRHKAPVLFFERIVAGHANVNSPYRQFSTKYFNLERLMNASFTFGCEKGTCGFKENAMGNGFEGVIRYTDVIDSLTPRRFTYKDRFTGQTIVVPLT
ncbi:MAG TPA: pre-peptidase C-terminal domain-containing protein [Pirellulaceae bacterium]|nr:pre-peptidase C-terminal domain-containing protein [Pirellulaceae bacterium]HMO94398.1 pre-peptidase C-terminal domain-containing protein [Pirellulaceae bacterium]HMP71411.1 pre-peptidase C-terminal domain-containing protein [Pirellulaceae bacterium]